MQQWHLRSVPSVGASDSTSLSSHKNVPIRWSQQFDGGEYNLILFELPEKGSIVKAKTIIDKVSGFLAKKPILIKDMFRLG